MVLRQNLKCCHHKIIQACCSWQGLLLDFTRNICWILKGMSWSHFAWEGQEEEKVDLQPSESNFELSWCWESSRKKPLHTVWQGSQKALGVLCHKHLGFSGWVSPHKNPWPYFQSHSADNTIMTGSQSGVFGLSRKSDLCVEGKSSFWVRHVATIPSFLIVKCQSEMEKVLTIWPEWRLGYVRISP